jgi:DNA-binding transcriptional LysR family regulator
MVAESQHDFPWDDVRVFLALLRHRTFRGAAGALGINASTIGRRLDALEGGLGVRLFDRTPDGVLLTAAGERLAPHAERLEEGAHGLRSAVDGLETRPVGLVKITAPPGVAEHFLAERLPELYRRYPDLRIEIDASIAYADLSRREADLALRALRPTSGDLVATRITEADDVILGAASLAKRPLRRLDDIPWITWASNLAHIPSAAWVLANVPPAAILLRTSSLGTQVAAAEAGIGALLLPRPYVGVRGLVELPLEPKLARRLPPMPSEQLWLCGHRALRDVPRIAVVWEMIVEALTEPARGDRSRRGSPGGGGPRRRPTAAAPG